MKALFNTLPYNSFPASSELLRKLDEVAKAIDDMPTYTSDDRAFLDKWEVDLPILQEDVNDLETLKANQITIAPTFSAETAYDIGDIVYYNGLTYRCTNAHEGEWDASDFAATTINNELASLNSNLNGLFTIGYFSATLAVGDNLLREADGSGGTAVTSGDLPTGENVYLYVVNCGADNSAMFSFHMDGSGTFKVIHCNTDVAQSVSIKWVQFNV